MNAPRLTLLSAALAATLAPTTADAVPVIAFGDSWANQSATELYNALSAAGYSTLLVQNSGIDGTTAEQYAMTPGALLGAVAANPDAEWVYLSLSGNDTFNHYAMNQPGTSAAENDANLRAILDALFAVHPDIRVVMFGYDRTNFVQNMTCMDQGTMFFGPGFTQAQINAIFESEVGNVMANVATSYPNVTYVPLWGTLQGAAGVAITQTDPSPSQFMADCFHLTSQGYRIIHDELVANYWDSFTPPTASFTNDGTALCLGNTLTLTNASTGQTSVRWFVDGQDAGTANSISVDLDTVGNVDLELRAFNQVWSDVATQTIVVDPCRDAGVPDSGTPDAGDRDGGAPDAGVVDAGDRDGGVEDAGFRDGGVRDGGPQRDGGPPRDGGPVPVRDGGPIPPRDGGPGPSTDPWTVGGGCTAASSEPTAWALFAIVLGGVFLRRRRS